MAKKSKRLHERLQELVGVTRSELIVAASIFTLSCCTLLYRWIANPEDPLNAALHERILFVLDSSSRARDSLRSLMPQIDRGDSLEFPDDIKAPSPYKRKNRPLEPVNVASADAQTLQQIPGIGPAIAARIVNYRRHHPLRKLEQLRDIKGIGPKLYQKITVNLCLKTPSPSPQAARKH